jgi:hypothetical protein
MEIHLGLRVRLFDMRYEGLEVGISDWLFEI